MVFVTAEPRNALGMQVQDLVQDLGDLARIDSRFGHAAELATELQVELGQLGEVASATPRPARRRSRHRPARRKVSSELVVLASLQIDGRGEGLSEVVEDAGCQSEDLFEGIAEGLGHLSWDQRETLVMRTGANDRRHSIEEVAEVTGCPVQLVPILEHEALKTLLSEPAVLNACRRLEALCAEYGIGWDDERLHTLVAALYPSTRANLTRLVVGLMREQGRVVAELDGARFDVPRGVERFDEMVIATLGRYGEMEPEQLTAHLHAVFPETDRARYAEMRIAERVRILGPAVQGDNGRFHLPETPVSGVDDRHIRALNGLIGALQKLGSARISALTNEVNRRLPRQFHIDGEYVRTWLTRHPELFVRSDADRFKLASLDVDILCGLATSWSPGGNGSAAVAAVGISGGRAAELRYERIALAIADYLRREGPQPIWKIRSHLYGRVIGPASADVVVATFPQRFECMDSGIVSLRHVEPTVGGGRERSTR